MPPDEPTPPRGGAREGADDDTIVEPGSDRTPFDILLRVQGLDTATSQLLHRRAVLPERIELDGINAQLGRVEALAGEVRTNRDAVVQRLTGLQQQVEGLEARRAQIEQRMYASRGLPARDLQAMDDEVHHLRRRRDELEDEELEAMEEQEPLDAQLDSFDSDIERLQSEADRLRHLVVAAESVLNEELRSVQAERSAAAEHLPADLSQRYESLRARLGGVGAARLVANRCEGCHLELPSVEIDRIRHLPDDELVTCDQCGRILVRTSGRDTAG